MRDIYGGAYDTLKLPGDLTASSFGKTVRSPRDEHHGLYYLIFTSYRGRLKSSRVKDVVSLQDSYNRDKACLIMVSFSLLAGQFAEADIAKSLLHMISNDIGQVR